tara:strand:+ start:918 stop:1451 length:534 start_codon:yes stop_codon:yes gene_type:complete
MEQNSSVTSVYKRWTLWRVVSLLLLLAIIAFWVWALSPLAPQGHPDKLDDPTFAVAAKPFCQNTETRINELPLALTAKNPEERADLIDLGTQIYRELIVDLSSIAPDPSSADGSIVMLWIKDYEIYLNDRDTYAQKFRDGIDEAFTVSKKGNRWVTEPIDEFAKANDLKECMTPLDV